MDIELYFTTADHIHLLGWGNLVLRASVSHDDVVLLVLSQQVQRGHFNLVKPTPFRRSPSTPRSRSIGERTDTLISPSRGRRARSLFIPPAVVLLPWAIYDGSDGSRERQKDVSPPPSLPPFPPLSLSSFLFAVFKAFDVLATNIYVSTASSIAAEICQERANCDAPSEPDRALTASTTERSYVFLHRPRARCHV